MDSSLPDQTILLDPEEIRLLGSLLEKQITTPEYYPLTLNALTNACNQKNNRDPVVSYDDATVIRALDSLRKKALVSTVTGAGIRVPKYKHGFDEFFGLGRQEVVLLTLLMLRGPQTPGELRNRAGSMSGFGSIEEVEAVLTSLNQHASRPLAKKLARQPGQKEQRYAHLLAGNPPVSESDAGAPPEAAPVRVFAEQERITTLESIVKELRSDITQLQQKFKEFKKQFE